MKISNPYLLLLALTVYTYTGSASKQPVIKQDEYTTPKTTQSYNIEDKKDSTNVIVTISGINIENAKTPNFNAKVKFDNDYNPIAIVISIDNQTPIHLEYDQQDQSLSVVVKPEVRKGERYSMIGYVPQVSRKLTSDLQLDKPQIAFNRESQTLTITIKKKVKEKEVSVFIK